MKRSWHASQSTKRGTRLHWGPSCTVWAAARPAARLCARMEYAASCAIFRTVTLSELERCDHASPNGVGVGRIQAISPRVCVLRSAASTWKRSAKHHQSLLPRRSTLASLTLFPPAGPRNVPPHRHQPLWVQLLLLPQQRHRDSHCQASGWNCLRGPQPHNGRSLCGQWGQGPLGQLHGRCRGRWPGQAHQHFESMRNHLGPAGTGPRRPVLQCTQSCQDKACGCGPAHWVHHPQGGAG
mmetsp:Transcript_25021/g.58210  ORF Transcript_25021/g.58210 Transcript_25021/m.58210 type:complete len:239 (-) Transcript_25021:161-877(-)